MQRCTKCTQKQIIFCRKNFHANNTESKTAQSKFRCRKCTQTVCKLGTKVHLEFRNVLLRSTVIAVKFQSRPLVSLARRSLARRSSLTITIEGGSCSIEFGVNPEPLFTGIFRIGIHVRLLQCKYV